MTRTQFIIRRVLWIIPVLFSVALITFIVMHATPGGPWDVDPNKADRRISDQLDKTFGLNKPLFFNPEAFQQAQKEGRGVIESGQAFIDAQFENYIFSLLRGDLGPSYRYRGRSVSDVIFGVQDDKPAWQSKIGTTATLGILALLFALAFGIPMGIISALKQNTAVDYASLFVVTIGYGIPSFVMGILLIIVFAVWLGVINVIEIDYWQRWQSWFLPTIVLGLPTAAFAARLTRASMLDVMRSDYIRTARAKGLGERVVVLRHMLRNALIPVVTFAGPALAGLVTGSFIIENQFGVAGIGDLFVRSVSRRDYTVIMALTLFYALLIALANLAVDIIYGFLDPRIQMGKKEG
ncbi:MAG: ABC transporter permease [Chloroflexi bacterium]|nr:ABC transporter permease [Chloroflexota bacterium]